MSVINQILKYDIRLSKNCRNFDVFVNIFTLLMGKLKIISQK